MTKKLTLSFKACLFSENFWLLFFTVLLLAARFLYLDAAPFVSDEPTFQLMLDEHFKAGTLPRHALIGSKGVHYGPTVLWIYGLVRLFSDNVRAVLFLDVLLSILGVLALYFSVKKAFSKSTAAWAIAIASSSPYLFFYSRIAWDVTLMVPLLGLLLFLVGKIAETEPSLKTDKRCFFYWISFGLVSALSFGTHLMALPVIFSAVLCLVFLMLKSKNRKSFFLGFTGAGFSFILVSIPYFSVLVTDRYQPAETTFSYGFWQELWGLGEGMLRYLGPAGMEYFIGGPLDTYLSVLSRLLLFIPIAAIAKALALGSIALFLVRALKNKAKNIVLIFCLLSFFMTLFYLKTLHIAFIHPHYFLPAWWLGAFFLALIVSSASGKGAVIFKASVSLLIVVNAVFIAETFGSIYKNHGTRGIYYGSALKETEDALKKICTQMQRLSQKNAHVDFSKATGLIEPSLVFLSAHINECRKKSLTFTAQGTASTAGYSLSYAEPAGLNSRILISFKN